MGRGKSSFGSIRKLPSSRYQARYTGPDLTRHTAPITFDTKGDAEAWLSVQRTNIVRDEWTPQARKAPMTFGQYAETWLAERDLKPRTRALYRSLLDRNILPTFKADPLTMITVGDVKKWHTALGKTTGPTSRAHSYGLLKTILNTAISEELLIANPCRIRGAGVVKRAGATEPATLDELATIVAAMPDRYQSMTLLAAWCGLRFGELIELRRKDIDTKTGVIRVRRGAVRVNGEMVVGTPKSHAGIRDVAVPPHLMPALKAHLKNHAQWGKDGLLFPAVHGGHLGTNTLWKLFARARKEAGRDDLRWHDLRHTGAVLAAQTGATLAELMSRLGHSTPGAALRYQHAAQGRDAVIAAKLSEIAGGAL